MIWVGNEVGIRWYIVSFGVDVQQVVASRQQQKLVSHEDGLLFFRRAVSEH